MSYRKHLMTSDEPPSELYKANEVGTEAISREQAIDALEKWLHGLFGITEADGTATIFKTIRQLPPIQSEIIRCKDCKWGAQDEVGRWFCRSLGCQIGNEDGSGFCADAERREVNNESN